MFVLEKAFDLMTRIVRRIYIKNVETVNCGSEYGGFAIYDHDIKLENNPVVYSFGVGEDISFDLDLIDKYDCNVYAFDPTPKSISWIEKQNVSDKFHFFPYGISDKDGIEKFHLPKNSDYVSGSVLSFETLQDKTIDVEMKKLSTIVSELDTGGGIDVLKMDIEGSEFSVIPDIMNSDVDIKQICVEIHYRMLTNANMNRIARVLGNSILNKHLIKIMKLMKKCNYECIYISDTCEEFTFRKRNDKEYPAF